MKIEAITLRELRMRLKAPYETSSNTEWDRRIVLLQVFSEGLSGWGEATVDEGPFFNGETTETAWHILCDFIVPMMLGRNVSGGEEAGQLLRTIRGNEMARAAFENAVWDIEAQRNNLPLSKQLGGTLTRIPCGAALGIQPTLDRLLSNVEKELESGYQRIKLKIKPGKDIAVVDAVRRVFPQIPLMVDGNAAYSLEDIELLERLDSYGLTMIEQPLWWDSILDHAKLQARLRTPVCLDECIRSASHAADAFELKACRILNLKLGRVGGHSEARRTHDVCVKSGIPIWCGGMLESGVGRAHNIAMSTLPGFSLPGDVSASKRYWDEDIIDPEAEVTPEGTIQVPTSPGLGYQVRLRRVDELTVRQRYWRNTVRVPVAGAVLGN
jgi:o-succinylbenzoate synthase